MIVPNVSKFRLYEFCALKLDVFHCLSLTIQTTGALPLDKNKKQ